MKRINVGRDSHKMDFGADAPAAYGKKPSSLTESTP